MDQGADHRPDQVRPPARRGTALVGRHPSPRRTGQGRVRVAPAAAFRQMAACLARGGAGCGGNLPLSPMGPAIDRLRAEIPRPRRRAGQQRRASGGRPRPARRRRRWDKKQVLKSIKAAAKAGDSLADSRIRIDHPALYGAAIRLFGTFTSARKIAGFKFKPKKRRKRSQT